jgi:hypothetical protein
LIQPNGIGLVRNAERQEDGRARSRERWSARTCFSKTLEPPRPGGLFVEKPLHIDIPVNLPDLQVPVSVADLAFEGDLPAFIIHGQLITKKIADSNANTQVIAVFTQMPVTQLCMTTAITPEEGS